MRTRPGKSAAFFAALAVLGMMLLVCIAASLAYGVRSTSFHDVMSVVSGKTQGIDPMTVAAIQARIPRTLLAIFVGSALALSGTLMQVLTRNPLADPGILGVNAGAATAVVAGITIFGSLPVGITALAALAGACLTAAIVYAVSNKVTMMSLSMTLVIVGTAVSAACASLTTLMLLSHENTFDQYRFWQLGSVAGRDSTIVPYVAILLVVGLALAVYSAPSLNILSLGDHVAAALSHQVARSKALVACAAVLLAAGATALAGPIAFVGLIVPHLSRMLVSAVCQSVDQRKILAVALFLGPCMMIAADVLGRLVHQPAEVPVGVMTTFVGVPVFLYVVMKRKIV